MKKNEEGFSLVVILLIVALVGFLGLTGWLVYTKNNQDNSSGKQVSSSMPAPTTVEDAAASYIMSRVGEVNFTRFYTFDKNRSSYTDPNHGKYDFMAFHFSPVKAITDYDDVIMVQVNRNNLEEVFADTVPDCFNDESLCKFNIDAQEALSIAKKGSLTANDLKVSWNNSSDEYAKAKGLAFVIVVSSCSQNKSIFIDYRDGKILGTEAGCGALD